MREFGNPMTIQLSKEASADQVVKELVTRAEEIDFIISLLKKKPYARTTLDKMVHEKFGIFRVSATSILEWFRTYGWVREEVLEEEEKDIECDIMKNYVEFVDGVAIAKTCYGNSKFILHNPVEGKYEYHGTRKIKVRRKYYTWVA